MKLLQGIPVSPGVVIGRAMVLEKSLHRVPFLILDDEEIPAELDTFDTALAGARDSVSKDRDRVAATLGEEPAKIFEFHLGLLSDSTLIDPISEVKPLYAQGFRDRDFLEYRETAETALGFCRIKKRINGR